MKTQTKNIVVLGGGYGGLMAALRLAGKTKRLDAEIILVNALDQFVERPRLHEQATGTIPKKWSISQHLKGTKVRFMQGWVTAIDPVSQRVSVQAAEGEQRLSYHYLVNALGSRVDRHASLGEGTLGLDAFRMIMRDSRLNDIPMILETPDESRWAEEIRLLKGMM